MRTLFHNGRILTGEGLLSPAPRVVDSLLVEDGVIIASGSADERVDLEGAFVVPGFNDAHLHLGEGARLRREVDLLGARSLTDALGRIERAAAGEPESAWITGGGWDESLWTPAVLPTRWDLDRVTGGRPAVFARVDVHVSVANSAALQLAGVTRETVAPPGSAIDRDARGEPTGILRERPARELVERHVPPVSLAVRIDGLRAVLREAVSLGITSVQDNSTDEDFAALRELHDAGELALRVSEWLPFDAPVAELAERRAAGPQTRFLRTGMLKAFLDGSLGARTASLRVPYADAPDVLGLAFYEPDHLTELALERARAGFRLGFHAIGDRALGMTLDAFAALHAEHPGARARVEHAQVAGPDDFARAARAGAIASMQPAHLLSDLRWVGQRLGPERAARAYAWRSFIEAGVPLAFGTDFPVEPLTPFRGLHAAATREGFHPEQRLSMAEALHAYTYGSAYAEAAEGWKGLLAPGFVADFCVLDRDLLAPHSVLDTRVLRTVVNGRTVFPAERG